MSARTCLPRNVHDAGGRGSSFSARPIGQNMMPLGTQALTALMSGKVAPSSSASSPPRDGPKQPGTRCPARVAPARRPDLDAGHCKGVSLVHLRKFEANNLAALYAPRGKPACETVCQAIQQMKIVALSVAQNGRCVRRRINHLLEFQPQILWEHRHRRSFEDCGGPRRRVGKCDVTRSGTSTNRRLMKA